MRVWLRTQAIKAAAAATKSDVKQVNKALAKKVAGPAKKPTVPLPACLLAVSVHTCMQMRDRLNKLVKLAKACNALKPKACSCRLCVDWRLAAEGCRRQAKQEAGQLQIVAGCLLNFVNLSTNSAITLTPYRLTDLNEGR